MDDLITFVRSKIAGFSSVELTHPETWSHLLPILGFNDENPHELPPEALLQPGAGLKIYQYPNQFAEYMAWIASNAYLIDSYLEIGTRHGGTFVTQVETLKLLNPNFSRAVAVDIIPQPTLLKSYEYFQVDSLSQSFSDWVAALNFDLVFVDGDHSYEGVKSDATVTRGCKIQVFHDISSDACPGVVNYWSEHKRTHYETHHFLEFTEQYSSVEGSYFGIGISQQR